jgi:hypothetical protein
MTTLLLTWVPRRWPWPNLAEVCEQTAAGEPFQTTWSSGRRKNVAVNDRIFLFRQGESPRGIVAAGRVTADTVIELSHYEMDREIEGDTSLQVKVEFDRVLDPAIVCPLFVEDLEEHWNTQASGITLSDASAAEITRRWANHLLDFDSVQSGQLPPTSAVVPAGDLFQIVDGDWREPILRHIMARRGQEAFREALRERYGDRCLMTGCRLLDALEAAHIKPYRGPQDNHPANGLLLRADLHTLFDLNLVGVEPETLIVHVHPSAREAGYGDLHGRALQYSSHPPSNEALTFRWCAFQRRLLSQ